MRKPAKEKRIKELRDAMQVEHIFTAMIEGIYASGDEPDFEFLASKAIEAADALNKVLVEEDRA